MITRAYLEEMSRYNAWQNAVVYGLCDRLSDAERRQDRGLFFGSLHGTLDHAACVDETILALLVSRRLPEARRGMTSARDWETLKRDRRSLDARILDLAETVPEADWHVPTRFNIPQIDGLGALPLGLWAAQLFNHQTHHRAQATAALHAMGIDYGCTDIPFRPGRAD